jgi:hypothetical protein
MNWTYQDTDPALMLWTAAVGRFGLRLPPDAQVVELGCAETTWLELMRQQNPGMTLRGVDARQVGVSNRDGCVLGSAMDAGLFAVESLDAVVMLGALEHFGLGFYGDPFNAAGDTLTMENVVRWLKPGGWVYFDVPANPTYAISPDIHYRIYSPAAVSGRLIVRGLHERARAYSLPEPNAGNWIEGEPQVQREPYHYVAVVADRP